MDNFSYHMPVKLFFGGVSEYAAEFAGYGKKALIVTGKSSARNGALNDVTACLSKNGAGFSVFDRTEENPSLANVDEAASFGINEGCDFIVAIGGGSPMDAAKAVSVLVAQPDMKAADLYGRAANARLPLLAVPTTSGTGSETTPFSILTLPEKKTKSSFGIPVFFDKAFLDWRYTSGMPESVTLSTALDVLAHLLEGYLSVRANPFNDMLAEGGLISFGRLMGNLQSRDFEPIRPELARVSALAGVVITSAKTSIPHLMGYPLTFSKNVPHGYSCAFSLAEYMDFHLDRERVKRACGLLGIGCVGGLREWIGSITLSKVRLTDEEIGTFAKQTCESPEKLRYHPYPIGYDDVAGLYKKSSA